MLSESEIFAPPLDTTFEINAKKKTSKKLFFRPVLIHKSPAQASQVSDSDDFV